MAIRKILTEPDPFLRQKSQDVEGVDDEIRRLMQDMLDTMYAAPGIGLAAIQVGVPKRIIVIDLSKEEVKKPLYFVNPRVILKSNSNATYEDRCHVTYLDYNGKQQELKAEGLLATCIQHEIDHLEGILFIDYLSKLKKSFIVKKLSKQKKSLERIVV
jgi:peptide deformylase